MDAKTMLVSIVAVLALLTLCLSPVACTMHRQRIIENAIATNPNADPIALKCAIEGTSGSTNGDMMCIMKAAQPHGGNR
jgi:hypothetical protein